MSTSEFLGVLSVLAHFVCRLAGVLATCQIMLKTPILRTDDPSSQHSLNGQLIFVRGHQALLQLQAVGGTFYLFFGWAQQRLFQQGRPSCIIVLFGQLSKEVASTTRQACTITLVQNLLTFCRSAYVDEGEVQSTFHLVTTLKQRVCLSFHGLQKRFLRWVKPPTTSFLLGTLADLLQGKSVLIAENAPLHQQLIILHRQIKRPVYKKTDRLLLVLLARMVRTG